MEIIRLNYLFSIIIAATLDFNFSNFTGQGILRAAFDPYVSIMANFTWGAIFGFIGIAIYANERSIGTATLYLILIGIFISIIFPNALMAIFALMLAFMLGVIFYRTFIQAREL